MCDSPEPRVNLSIPGTRMNIIEKAWRSAVNLITRQLFEKKSSSFICNNVIYPVGSVFKIHYHQIMNGRTIEHTVLARFLYAAPTYWNEFGLPLSYSFFFDTLNPEKEDLGILSVHPKQWSYFSLISPPEELTYIGYLSDAACELISASDNLQRIRKVFEQVTQPTPS